jgi:hypothetical protein
MKDQKVEGRIEQGILILTVNFDAPFLFQKGAGNQLSTELTNCYQNWKGKAKTPSCVVEIQADIAGTPLIRGLFELWKVVAEGEGGQVVCVNYPQDYIDSLTSLGLLALKGFSMARTAKAAIRKLTWPAPINFFVN